jgi:hypothetical protein
LFGEKQDNWEEYCKSFVKEAIKRALAKAQKIKVEDDEDATIGFNNILDSIIEILMEKGYEKKEYPEYLMWGTCGIDKSRDELKNYEAGIFDEIFEHNKKTYEEHSKWMRSLGY